MCIFLRFRASPGERLDTQICEVISARTLRMNKNRAGFGIHFSNETKLYGSTINFELYLTPECPMNKLGYIHDLDGHLISFHMGQHGSHTLLTGGNDGLGACA